MAAEVKIGSSLVGEGHPVYVIAEIGINHNGSLSLAKKLIDGAVFAGCNAVKFQKRTPELCVPQDQWNVERETPWGRMTYLEYKHKIEFGFSEYEQIDHYCKEKGIDWFVSAWDEESIDFIDQFNPVAYKIASATLTDYDLLNKIRNTGKPVILSTGMSTMEEIQEAVDLLDRNKLLIAQSTSCYPCSESQLNLKMICTFKNLYPGIPIGYSGHETGLAPTLGAVALGASFIERHITLDRAMWGTDQAASVEVHGMYKLVKNIRDIELSLGDGRKKVYDDEIKNMTKMRKNNSQQKLVG
ncbi:MAG TPA: N-acetylneuraminate synthase family protein [Melioribacteraceae bacterium]|nr:N-acetylneuraminate synthase family protein [Melioribacteraceae bacterium]